MPHGEVKTDDIVRQAFRDGKQVFIPYLHKEMTTKSNKPESVMDMVSLSSLGDYETLQPDAWGIPSVSHDSVSERRRCLPSPDQEGEELDLVILPGVAFDEGGRRLGHGRGFYDLFLNRYEQTVKARNPDAAMPFLGTT